MDGITITHPRRVLFPEDGITKGEVARHYDAVASRLLDHTARHPVTLKRCPEGIDACFIQRHPGRALPPEVPVIPLREASGEVDDYIWIDGKPAVLALVQMHVIEFHVWGARIDDVERPDRLVFDLDPAPELPFAATRAAAREIARQLDSLGLPACPMLTGGKGIHVVAPLRPRARWELAHRFARRLAERLAAQRPERFTASARREIRAGRIFIDWLRNTRSASAIAPWSLRARRGAPVATPVAWDELDGCASAQAFGLRNLAPRLARPCPLAACRRHAVELTERHLAALD